MPKTIDPNQYLIDTFKSHIGDPKDIAQKRSQAQAQFCQTLLPTPKNEQYKYTPITTAITQAIQQHTTTLKNTDALATQHTHINQINNIQLQEATNIVIVNGTLAKNLSTPTHNINISNFNQAHTQYQQTLETQFDRIAQHIKDPLIILNTALFQDGLFINIPPNTTQETIVIHHINDNQEQTTPHPEILINSRILINIEQNAEVNIIQNFTSQHQHNKFTNNLTEITIAPSSTLNHYTIQNSTLDNYIIDNLIIELNNNSTLNNFNINLNGKLTRNNTHVTLNDQNSFANMYGLYIINDNTHTDNNITINHDKQNTFSNQLYKGILAQKSTGVFNGKIHVKQHAQHINAFQANNNIILSDDARLYTKPQLEIYADDVKCSHGATIGQIDQEQTFYMQSRGIPKEEATNILLNAFVNDIIDKIPSPPIKQHITHITKNKISELYTNEPHTPNT
jgi:Fe-S cluster assembly protein SufD